MLIPPIRIDVAMDKWILVFVVSLICHGVYSKPHDQNEGEPEQFRREFIDQNGEEPGYVIAGLGFLGKLHMLAIAFV